MTIKRVLALAILTIASASLVLGNDLKLGSRLPNDYVIRNVSIDRPPSKHAQKLIIPIADRSNISSIDVLDRNVTSNQSASIILGGVGHRLAILYLNSPPQRSLNFTVIARGLRPLPPPPPSKPVPPPPPPHQGPPPPPPHERPPPPPPARRPPPPPPPSDEDQYDDIFEFDDQFF